MQYAWIEEVGNIGLHAKLKSDHRPHASKTHINPSYKMPWKEIQARTHEAIYGISEPAMTKLWSEKNTMIAHNQQTLFTDNITKRIHRASLCPLHDSWGPESGTIWTESPLSQITKQTLFNIFTTVSSLSSILMVLHINRPANAIKYAIFIRNASRLKSTGISIHREQTHIQWHPVTDLPGVHVTCSVFLEQ